MRTLLVVTVDGWIAGRPLVQPLHDLGVLAQQDVEESIVRLLLLLLLLLLRLRLRLLVVTVDGWIAGRPLVEPLHDLGVLAQQDVEESIVRLLLLLLLLLRLSLLLLVGSAIAVSVGLGGTPSDAAGHRVGIPPGRLLGLLGLLMMTVEDSTDPRRLAPSRRRRGSRIGR